MRARRLLGGAAGLVALLTARAAFGAEPGVSAEMFTVNNLWMMIATFLVFVMHLGFATLETGLTRAKNTVNILFKNTLIVAIGLGVGLLIAATALVPLSHALTGGYTPFVPGKPLLAILGGSTVLAILALAVPTRRALRARPIAAVGVAE